MHLVEKHKKVNNTFVCLQENQPSTSKNSNDSFFSCWLCHPVKHFYTMQVNNLSFQYKFHTSTISWQTTACHFLETCFHSEVARFDKTVYL